MRCFYWLLLIGNAFFMFWAIAAGYSLWWVSLLGVLFACVALVLDAKTRRAKAEHRVIMARMAAIRKERGL